MITQNHLFAIYYKSRTTREQKKTEMEKKRDDDYTETMRLDKRKKEKKTTKWRKENKEKI